MGWEPGAWPGHLMLNIRGAYSFMYFWDFFGYLSGWHAFFLIKGNDKDRRHVEPLECKIRPFLNSKIFIRWAERIGWSLLKFQQHHKITRQGFFSMRCRFVSFFHGTLLMSWQEQKFTSKCLSFKRTMLPRFGLFQLGKIWNVHYPESRCFIFTMILDISPYGRSFSSSNRRAAKACQTIHPMSPFKADEDILKS